MRGGDLTEEMRWVIIINTYVTSGECDFPIPWV